MDIPWYHYLANLHEYWIESHHRETPVVHRFLRCRLSAEVPIQFACRCIARYLMCFRQFPRCRISTPAMPTQTVPRRAPPAGPGTVGRRLRSRRPQRRRRREGVGNGWRAAPGTAAAKQASADAAAATANLKLGRLSWPLQAHAARTGALPPGTWPWPALAAPRRVIA